jgi:putative heme-binding domain-containing protein
MRALDHILNPSRVIDEKYRNTTLTLKDGAELSGAIESEDDKNVVIRIDPLAGQPTVVARGTIRQRESSSVSPMPEGLLNHLQAGQILDLLAFLESGGDPNASALKPGAASNAS